MRIIIADDHPIVRAGLRRIVEAEETMRVVAEASSGDDLLALVADVDCDVALVDLSMPGPDFMELLARLRAARPSVAVLVLSVFPEEQFAPRALRAGAMGYVSKEQSPEQLVTALRRVHGGQRYISPNLASWLATRIDDEYRADPLESLSKREHQVLRLIGAGSTIKEVAAQLGLSHKTVSTYRGRLLKKLGLTSTFDLVRLCIQRRLTE